MSASDQVMRSLVKPKQFEAEAISWAAVTSTSGLHFLTRPVEAVRQAQGGGEAAGQLKHAAGSPSEKQNAWKAQVQ